MGRHLLAFLFAVLVAAPAFADDDRLRLRVVTINAWGLPWITPSREARIEALGAELAALKPDVVLAQEVWLEEDGVRLAADLAAAGLPHAVHFDDGFLGSGVLIASVYPIERSSVEAFELGGKPHKPYHGDWYARKGVGQAVLSTPLGPVTVASTHMHAGYGSDEYDLIRLAQSLQAADMLGDHGLMSPQAGDPATPPLILGGDLNCKRGSLAFRLLTSRAALTPVDSELGVDWILYRHGGELEVRVRKVKVVLDGEVALSDGAERTVSDHDGVMAELELRRAKPPIPASARREAWRAAADEALPLIEAELSASSKRGGKARRSGILLLLVSLALFGLLWRYKGRGRWIIGLVALVLVHTSTWRVYVGFIYEPTLRVGLQNAHSRLQEG